MNRKKFLKNASSLLAGGAAFCLCQGSAVSLEVPPVTKECPELAFAHSWVKALLEAMDAQLDESVRKKLMETNGRACARRGAIGLARNNQGKLAQFLSALATHLGPENARREGGTVTIVYKECLCPLMKNGPARLSNTYCHCSRGWLKEMLETVTGKSVEVVLQQSIKQGAENCRFEAMV
jgi:predicted hydrocarbon binding protein